MKNTFVSLIILILSSFLSCTGGGRTASGTTDDKDTLVLILLNDPVTLNTVSATDAYSSEIFNRIFDGLTDVDENLNPIPCIAKSWDWKTNVVDNITNYLLTFHLRDDVYWHDGVKLTADDYVYTYEKIMDPKSKAFNKVASYEGLVTNVVALDDTTLQITYVKPYAAAVLSWGELLPKHIYENEDFEKSKYNRSPIGVGPYRFVEWERGKYIKLEVNTNYWRKQPNFKRIIFKVIADDNVALIAFQKGELDVMELTSQQYFKEKDMDYFKNGYNFYQFAFYRNGFSQIAWNCGDKSLFNDKRVRQAMTYSLDRQTLASTFFHGLRDVVSGPFFKKSWAYNQSIEPLPFDLNQAKSLLAETGWKDSDGDGLLDKDGKPFQFELLLGDTPAGKAMALNLKENLNKIGINMEMIVLEWSAFSKRINEHNFDAALFSWAAGLDPDAYDMFHSSQISKGVNYGNYSNALADKLMEQARQEMSQDKRTALSHKIHAILAEDQPYTFCFTPYSLIAAKKNIKGIKITSAGIVNYYPGINAWYKE